MTISKILERAVHLVNRACSGTVFCMHVLFCTPDREIRCFTLDEKFYITHVNSPKAYVLLLNINIYSTTKENHQFLICPRFLINLFKI